MYRTAKNRYLGITLIEILLILGILAVIASLALPSTSKATSRTEMRVASENLKYSIRTARNTARMAESKVTMNISEFGQDGQSQRITFSVSGPGQKATAQALFQEDHIPADIKLVSDNGAFEFDDRGIVLNPGVITLVSMIDESLQASITVE
jgi:type II secretory pathway pseudopilin PulG